MQGSGLVDALYMRRRLAFHSAAGIALPRHAVTKPADLQRDPTPSSACVRRSRKGLVVGRAKVALLGRQRSKLAKGAEPTGNPTPATLTALGSWCQANQATVWGM